MALLMQWIVGIVLIAASFGVILFRKPVHSALAFLLSLLMLAALYLELNAQLIAVFQVLIYAGAILVVFVFVMILFQDANQQIQMMRSNNVAFLLGGAVLALLATLAILGDKLLGFAKLPELPPKFGSAYTVGKTLYVDYFFPFEAVIVLFLIALVGGYYIARKGE